jgi:hypothetical protein
LNFLVGETLLDGDKQIGGVVEDGLLLLTLLGRVVLL